MENVSRRHDCRIRCTWSFISRLTPSSSSSNSETVTGWRASPPPSSVTLRESTEIDYAAQLRKIPGFEGYACHGSNSTANDGTIHTRQSLAGTATDDGLRQHGSAIVRLPDFRQDSVGAASSPAVLSQLKSIIRKRDLLLHVEVRIENVYKELAEMRESIDLELANGTRMASDDRSDVATLRQQWKHHLEALRRLTDLVAQEESELEPLQQQLTRTQSEVKVAEDDLYALLTDGRRPGDSDVSREDRLLATLVSGPVDAHESVPELHDNLTIDPPPAYCTLEPTFSAPDASFADPYHEPDHHQKAELKPDSRPETPIDTTATRRSSSDVGQALSQDMVTAWASRRRRLLSADTAFCGYCLPQDDLHEYIAAAARDPSLLMVNPLADMRRVDLRNALGFDLAKIDAKITLTHSLQKEVAVGVAQKLTNIRVPTIHTRQFISLWGRGMSQNAVLESWRTLLYSSHDYKQLVKKGNIGQLVKLVQDVRNLEVPLNNTSITDQPEITVGGHVPDVAAASSVGVEPSGKLKLDYIGQSVTNVTENRAKFSSSGSTKTLGLALMDFSI